MTSHKTITGQAAIALCGSLVIFTASYLKSSSTARADSGIKPQIYVDGNWTGKWNSVNSSNQGALDLVLNQDTFTLHGQGTASTDVGNTRNCLENFAISGLVANKQLFLALASQTGDIASLTVSGSSVALEGRYRVTSGPCKGDVGNWSLERNYAESSGGAENPQKVIAPTPPAQPEELSLLSDFEQETDAVSSLTEVESEKKESETRVTLPPEQSPESAALQPGSVKSNSGIIITGANIRKGPGTEHDRLSALPRGTKVEVRGENGDWYEIIAELNNETVSAWVYAPLVTFDENDPRLRYAESEGGTSPGGNRRTKLRPGETQIYYAGYSEEFSQVKKLLMQNKLDEITEYYNNKEKEIREMRAARAQNISTNTGGYEYSRRHEIPISRMGTFEKEVGLLRWLERGTLAIAQGDYQEAIEYFSLAEHLLERRMKKSKIESVMEKVATRLAETISGNEELGQYLGEGYERVLMLNYKSIAYLLQGKREAYNVTRRAIDWQQIEKKEFENDLEKIREKLEKKETKATGFSDIFTSQIIPENYVSARSKAKSIPSAYVNPFGYYMAGMIQEYESYSDWSLRDNARISYSKALDLNPGSKVLKKAVRDLDRESSTSGGRLVHVLVGDGWVPEKKVLEYAINMQGNVVPVKLPIYVPVKNRVKKLNVYTSGGKYLATLSPVADIEAIAMRHQADIEPILRLRAMTAVMTSAVSGAVASKWEGIMGAIMRALNRQRDELRAPNTQSWLSLPSSIQAARIYLKKGVGKIRVSSYDQSGNRMTSKIVNIRPNEHDFVYVRSFNNKMYAHSANKRLLAAN